MSRGDDSDEEVYLSDPETDDGASVEDYEHSDDTNVDTGHNASEPAPQDEIDYALHDAEMQRAAQRPDSAPPKPDVPPARSALSPDAAPWVPSGYSGSQPATEPGNQPLASNAPPTGVSQNGASDKAVDPPVRSIEPGSNGQVPHANGRKELDSETPSELTKPLEANPEPAAPVETETPAENPASASVTYEQTSHTEPQQPTSSAESHDNEQKSPAATESSQAQQSASSLPKDEEQAVKAVEEAKTPEQETQALATQLPTTEAASAAPSVPSVDSQATSEPDKESSQTGPQKPVSEQTSEAPKETSGGIDEDETKELAAELPTSAAAAPAPNTTDASREEVPSTSEVASGIASNSATEMSPEQREETPQEASSSSTRSSGGPSLPPRAGPKGLGSGLGLGSGPRGMPSLPTRPARRASQPIPQDEEEKAEGGERQQEPERPVQQPSNDEAPASGSQAAASGRQEEQQPAGAIQARVGPSQPAPATQAVSAPEPVQESDQVKKVRAKLRDLRVQLFRLAHRLGYQEHNLVKTIKYRLDHAERVRLDRAATQEDLMEVAKNMEAESPESEIYEVTVMVIGLSGSGKSALINSLLGEEVVSADAFEGTKDVKVVQGTLYGLTLRLIDTPGLLPAADAQAHNMKVLKKIEKARKKYKPDLLLYTERMDMLRRDLSDLPVLRLVSDTLGPDIWFNTLIVITHATATITSPRGDVFPFDQLSQTRAAMFQRALQATVGDARVNVPTAFAENSSSCPTGEDGEAILPNGLQWRRFILIYLASIKVLREADTELQASVNKKQESNAMSQLSMLLQAQRGVKLPPLPFLITNMIKHAGPKQYPQGEQDIKREDEIKAIKRFGPRRKEFRKRTEFLKGKQAERRLLALGKESEEPEIDPYEPPNQGPALSPTFDSDDNALYYRAYEPRAGEGGWLTRPRLEQNVTDHTDGVESLTTERSFVKRSKGQDLDGIPSTVHAIIQKDKCNQLFQGGAEASYYQNYRIVHTGRGQVMTLSGGDMLFITQLETMLKAIPRNKLTLGGMLSRLSEEDQILPLKGKVAVGMKLENELELPESQRYNLKNNIKAGIGKGQVKLGQGRKEQATGMNAEWQLVGGAKENVQVMASFSQMKYRGNNGRQYALSANLPVTDETTLSPKLQLQSGQGSLSLRCASYDHSNIGLTVFLPLGKALWDKFRSRNSKNDQQIVFA